MSHVMTVSVEIACRATLIEALKLMGFAEESLRLAEADKKAYVTTYRDQATEYADVVVPKQAYSGYGDFGIDFKEGGKASFILDDLDNVYALPTFLEKQDIPQLKGTMTELLPQWYAAAGAARGMVRAGLKPVFAISDCSELTITANLDEMVTY